MDFSELQRELKTIIKDASPEITVSVPDIINEAVAFIANEILFPSLKALITLTSSTTVYYVNMPTGFAGKLLYCGNSNGTKNIMNGGLQELLETYPGMTDTGAIIDVALEGSILYYQGMPSTAETLTCLVYNDPSVLSADSDTPSFIPEYLHRQAIVYKAAEIAFDVIEDALEDKIKPNTKNYQERAAIGIAGVAKWVHKSRTNVGTSVWKI